MNEVAPPPSWKTSEVTITSLVISLIIWSFFAELDQTVTATGEVIPSGQTKIVQHLEGGIIEAIHIQPGTTVSMGQRLITLNKAGSQYNLEELQATYDGLMASRVRLNAEIENTFPSFPEKLQQTRPQIIEAEIEILQAHQNELNRSLQVISSQKALRHKEIDEANTRVLTLQRQLEIKRRELGIIQDTFDKNLTSELKLLAAKSTTEQLQGDLEVAQKSILTAQESLQEITARQEEIKAIFMREIKEERSTVEQKMIAIQERIWVAQEQRLRAEIRSPIDGEVKSIHHHTIGGVVAPAEPLLEIVPLEDELVIEAHLSPADRAYVSSGTSARIKIGAYDFIRYGTLQGTVKTVAADTELANDGTAFYRITVATDHSYLGDNQETYPIIPGMEASVDIHAGTQTIFDYLITPVLKLRHDAFREP